MDPFSAIGCTLVFGLVYLIFKTGFYMLYKPVYMRESDSPLRPGHLNHAPEGGLYAELVENRSFEFDPIDRHDYHALMAWEKV